MLEAKVKSCQKNTQVKCRDQRRSTSIITSLLWPGGSSSVHLNLKKTKTKHNILKTCTCFHMVVNQCIAINFVNM